MDSGGSTKLRVVLVAAASTAALGAAILYLQRRRGAWSWNDAGIHGTDSSFESRKQPFLPLPLQSLPEEGEAPPAAAAKTADFQYGIGLRHRRSICNNLLGNMGKQLQDVLDAEDSADDAARCADAVKLLVDNILPSMQHEGTSPAVISSCCGFVTQVFDLAARVVELPGEAAQRSPGSGSPGLVVVQVNSAEPESCESADASSERRRHVAISAAANLSAKAVLAAIARHPAHTALHSAGWEALVSILRCEATAAAVEPWWRSGGDGIERVLAASLASTSLRAAAQHRAFYCLGAILKAFGSAGARGRLLSAGCLEPCLALLEGISGISASVRRSRDDFLDEEDGFTPGAIAEVITGTVRRLTVPSPGRNSGVLWRTIGLPLSERCAVAVFAVLRQFPHRPGLADEACKLLIAMVDAGPKAAECLGQRSVDAVAAALSMAGVQESPAAVRSGCAALRALGPSAGASAPRGLAAALAQIRLHKEDPRTLAAAFSAVAALLSPGPQLHSLASRASAAGVFEDAAAAIERPGVELHVCVAATQAILALAGADEEDVYRRSRLLQGSLNMSVQACLNRHLTMLDPTDPESFAVLGKKLLAVLGVMWDFQDALRNALKRRSGPATPPRAPTSATPPQQQQHLRAEGGSPTKKSARPPAVPLPGVPGIMISRPFTPGGTGGPAPLAEGGSPTKKSARPPAVPLPGVPGVMISRPFTPGGTGGPAPLASLTVSKPYTPPTAASQAPTASVVVSRAHPAGGKPPSPVAGAARKQLLGGDNAATTDEDLTTCTVCSFAPRDMALIPCGHVSLCEGCWSLLQATGSGEKRPMRCPLCSTDVQMAVKLRLTS